jgi:predicted transcriptional regulator
VGIQECVKIMSESNIGSLVIMSENQEIVGIVTKTDLKRDFAKNHKNEKIVEEYMSARYSWAYSDVLPNKVVSKMLESKISRVIIKNSEDTPIGIITFRDLFNLVMSMGIQRDMYFQKVLSQSKDWGKHFKQMRK